MVENDIYDNKRQYENFKARVDNLSTPVNELPRDRYSHRKYWVKNKANIKYFKQLFKVFERKDLSYIRRIRLLRVLLMVCHFIKKDLANIDRANINNMVIESHNPNKSNKSKKDFIIDIKHIWRQLFQEKDEQGRVDETLTPYFVRHLKFKIDKSTEKTRPDKFKYGEFEKLVSAFSNDVRIQALLTLAFESLARPQELMFLKIKDITLKDNYASIEVSEHGKEGIKILRCMDSYFYVSKWYNQHPLKDNSEAFFFINIGRTKQFMQMKPPGANKLIRERCKKIGINKTITLYSLKRNGVTFRRLRGDSDLDIQHTAGWTSTKQLNTYDQSVQEESYKLELIKRGLIKADKDHKHLEPKTKSCVFCQATVGIAEKVCPKCKRPIDRKIIEKEMKDKDNELDVLKNQMAQMLAKVNSLEELKEELVRRGK